MHPVLFSISIQHELIRIIRSYIHADLPSFNIAKITNLTTVPSWPKGIIINQKSLTFSSTESIKNFNYLRPKNKTKVDLQVIKHIIFFLMLLGYFCNRKIGVTHRAGGMQKGNQLHTEYLYLNQKNENFKYIFGVYDAKIN